MLTLDTNIIIHYFQDDAEIADRVEQWNLKGQQFNISTITELELFSSPHLTPEETRRIGDFVMTLTVIPLDSAIARIAAEVRRRYRLRTPDSAIAATAIFSHSALVTRDLDHFNLIKELKIETV